MPRFRTIVIACFVVVAGAVGMSLWMSAWPRMHDRATEAAVAARHEAAPKPKHVAPAAKRRVPARAPAAAAVEPARAAAPPSPVHSPSPPYPMVALREQQGGVVVLRVSVDGTGAVTAVDVARSSGHAALDASARDTMREWRFEPPAGHAPTTFDYPVRFRIGDP